MTDRPTMTVTIMRQYARCCPSGYIFRPVQLGVGTPGGCEAAVHSARRFPETIPNDRVVVKLDFSNAFNYLHRSDMLKSIADRIPELHFTATLLMQIRHYCISQYIIMTQENTQQGDSLGPLLFL